jgi:hypothetical protein
VLHFVVSRSPGRFWRLQMCRHHSDRQKNCPEFLHSEVVYFIERLVLQHATLSVAMLEGSTVPWCGNGYNSNQFFKSAPCLCLMFVVIGPVSLLSFPEQVRNRCPPLSQHAIAAIQLFPTIHPWYTIVWSECQPRSSAWCNLLPLVRSSQHFNSSASG